MRLAKEEVLSQQRLRPLRRAEEVNLRLHQQVAVAKLLPYPVPEPASVEPFGPSLAALVKSLRRPLNPAAAEKVVLRP